MTKVTCSAIGEMSFTPPKRSARPTKIA